MGPHSMLEESLMKSLQAKQRNAKKIARKNPRVIKLDLQRRPLVQLKKLSLRLAKSSSNEKVRDAREAFGILPPGIEVQVVGWPKL